MSISKYSRKDFLALKSLPSEFKFSVEDWREMETQFGKGVFLVGSVVQTPTELKKKGPIKGLLRVSPTTATSLEKLGIHEWNQLKGTIVHFEFSQVERTIIVRDVKNWTGESITKKEEPETPSTGE